MATKIYNKLVRDKIPDIIRGDNAVPYTRILDDLEYQQALIDKLKEETDEFEAEPSLKELADIQEVIFALLKQLKYSPQQLVAETTKKTAQRGGFEKRIYLESVDEDTTLI